MDILLQLIYSGIALGMIYAVIAFGYQLTFATSDTLNFGQGEALMLGALVGLSLVDTGGINYWLAIPVVGVFGLFQGALVERGGKTCDQTQERIWLDHVDHCTGNHFQKCGRKYLGAR